MSRFGWAYVNDIITGSASAAGPTNSVQYNSGSGILSGTSNLTFNPLTNTLTVIGTISASAYQGVSGSGGSTSPGGSNTSIQFNSGSTFSGSSNLTYNYSTNNLSLTGALLMSGTSYISEVDYIDFDVSASIPAYKLGRMYYDTDTADLAYYLTYANQKLQLGQQTVIKVKNSTGSPISKGKLVQITGAVGDNPLINTASWENDNNSANTLGMLMSTVANGDFGYALLNGVITGVNTDPATYSEGQIVYLSSSGDYTNITPTAPKHTVRLGQVLRAHATVGSIFVKIDNGYELDELHNILITSASTGDLLTYNSSSALWTNTKSLTGSYTLTGSLSASSTITAASASFDVFILNRTVISTNLNLASNKHIIGVATSAATASVTISLPNASTLPSGKHYIIKDEDGNANARNIIVSCSIVGQTIDGLSSVTLNSPYSALNIYCDGTSKYFIY